MATDLPSDRLLDAVLALSRAVVAITAKSPRQLHAEVTLTQYRTLVVLASRGPQRTQDLAAELGVTRSTVTRWCDRLAQRGWVRREYGDTRRRIVLVVLTPSGKQLVGQAMRHRRREVSKLLGSFSPRQAQAAVKVMTSIAQAAGEVSDPLWWANWARSAHV